MRKGSRVQLGDNRGPEYRVVCIDHGMAWVTAVEGCMADCVVPIDRLREINAVYPSEWR